MPTPTLSDLVELSGGSARPFFTKHSQLHDAVQGPVLDVVIRQTIDPKTKKPQFWEDANGRPDPESPRWQAIVTIQTDLDDGPDEKRNETEDNGERAIFVKWWSGQRKNFLSGLKAAGLSMEGNALPAGTVLRVELTDIEPSKDAVLDDTKVYTYTFNPKPEEAAAPALPASSK